MIGLDTNVVIAWLAGDQGPAKRRELDVVMSDPAQRLYLNNVVIMEIAFVLRGRKFRKNRAQIADILDALCGAANIVIADAEQIRKSIAQYRGGGDLQDFIIAEVNAAHGCDTTLTYDKRASRHPAMTLL